MRVLWGVLVAIGCAVAAGAASAATILVETGAVTTASHVIHLPEKGVFDVELTTSAPVTMYLSGYVDAHRHIEYMSDRRLLDGTQHDRWFDIASGVGATAIAGQFIVPRETYEYAPPMLIFRHYEDPSIYFSFSEPPSGVTYTLRVTGYFTPDPVPEPATWAMMLLGFGVIGAAVRQRRQATVA